MKIHAYTTPTSLVEYQKGHDFRAWAENALTKPANAFIHISFHAQDVLDINEKTRTYLVLGRRERI